MAWIRTVSNWRMLRSPTLTRQTSSIFNPSNKFDAEGLTTVIESVENRRKLRNDIEQESMVKIRNRNLEAEKQVLDIEKQSEEARLEQEREIEFRRAQQRAELARERSEREKDAEQATLLSQEAIETARIANERQIAEAKIESEREVRQREIDRQRVVEEAEIAMRETLGTGAHRAGKDAFCYTHRQGAGGSGTGRLPVNARLTKKASRHANLLKKHVSIRSSL